MAEENINGEHEFYCLKSLVAHSLDDFVERGRGGVVAENEPGEESAFARYGRAVHYFRDGLVRRLVVQRSADVRLAVTADDQTH